MGSKTKTSGPIPGGFILTHTHMGVAQIQQERLRRFWPLFPLTRVPFWYQFFEPQPYEESFRLRRFCPPAPPPLGCSPRGCCAPAGSGQFRHRPRDSTRHLGAAGDLATGKRAAQGETPDALGGREGPVSNFRDPNEPFWDSNGNHWRC